MKKIQNKRGIQLNEAFVAVLSVVLIAILVIIAIVLFNSLSTITLVHNTAGISVNETVTKTASGLAFRLDCGALRDGICGDVTAVYNGTGGSLLPLANFSQASFLGNDNSIIYNESVTTTWATNLLVTYPYTYTANSASTNASNDTIDQFSTYPALIGLIGTIVFLGIVIGVLVTSFMPGSKA